MKLLIVDDHPGVRTMIRQLAAAPGDIVRECGSADEAVSLAVDFKPDNVTLDVRMPGMCSFEAARAIRAIHPSVKIVVVTSYDEPLLRRVAKEAGIVDFFVKENLSDLRASLARNDDELENIAATPAGTTINLPIATEEIQHLRERIKYLEAEMLERDCFPAMVAHELRSPICVVDAFAALLEERFSNLLPTEARYCLQVINENCARTRDRLEGLISLAQSNRQIVHTKILSMETLARDVWNSLCSESQREQITFKIEQLPEATGDTTLLRVLLETLLGNAVKFSSRVPRPVIEVGGSGFGDTAIYFVKDNGAGFDSSLMDRLFEPLSRLHTDPRFPGTGLGLALARRIVVTHGGRIWAEGIPNRGATFYFTLPRYASRPSSLELHP